MKPTTLALAILFVAHSQEAVAAVARMQSVAAIESDSPACVASFNACDAAYKNKDSAQCKELCEKAKNDCSPRQAGKGPARNNFEMAKTYSLSCRQDVSKITKK